MIPVRRKMKNITRRNFLRTSITGVGALALSSMLGGCSQATPTPAGAAKLPVLPTVPANSPYMVVARAGEPEALIQRAMAAFGGMETFVKKGSTVILKPNICTAYHSYEYAATTNPFLVGALVKLCLAAGAKKVTVMDFPFGSTAEEAYTVSGIADQVKAAGGEMIVMSDFKFVPTDIPYGVELKKTDIYDDILKADVVINVPIAKNHGLARITMGMKNLLGVIKDRPPLHINLGQSLPDLATRIRPTLTVLDAIRILTANGPTGGNLDDVKKLDTVIVSPDYVAVDAYGSTLFGLKPTDLYYVKNGAKSGFGRADIENLKIEEITVGA
jgi:uncharacterized protein (DUF362 family)